MNKLNFSSNSPLPFLFASGNNDLSLSFSRVEIGSNRFEKSVEEEEKKSSRVRVIWAGFEVEKLKRGKRSSDPIVVGRYLAKIRLKTIVNRGRLEWWAR